jgi:hypothetical protein
VYISTYDHPVFPPAIPLARADGRVVHDRPLGPKLEVVGIDKARALPGQSQHMEHLEQGDRWLHADGYLAKVDEDHHQNEELWQ